MKRVLSVAAASLVGAAVSASAVAAGGPSPGVVSGWDGVRAPGGAVRYVALPGGAGTTVVATVRVRDGRIMRSAVVPRTLGIPQVAFDGTTDGLSADGRLLVLASPAMQPGPGVTTTFTVLRTRTLKVARTIKLPGMWAFDALSPDGGTVYAIEYQSAVNPVRYRVRAVDVATGRARPGAIVDKREPDEQMAGMPMARAKGSPGMALTLYGKADGTAFVHALDTRHGTASCIDLPWRGVGDAVWKVRLGVGGGMLHLSQPGLGRLATVDLSTLAVRSFRLPVS
jgi:hypothetical protein